MNDRKMLTAKEVGLRIKERRNELKISMPELGRRVGVNKSTIQRYETDGVNPTRSTVSYTHLANLCAAHLQDIPQGKRPSLDSVPDTHKMLICCLLYTSRCV